MRTDLLLLIFLVSIVSLVVFEILMLINAAKTQQWGWFVVMLFFIFPLAIAYRFLAYQSSAEIEAQERQRRRRALQREQALKNEIAALKDEVKELKSGQPDSGSSQP